MTTAAPPTSDPRVFGDELIRTGDLDPVYIAIYGANLPEWQKARVLVGYWMFYHLGVAAWLSEQEGRSFWHWAIVAAENVQATPTVGGRWPRSAERRHFRGQKCVDAVTWLARREPEELIHSLERHRTEVDVMAEVQQWPMFGPWIGFKAADMMERVWGSEVRFNPDIGLLYSEPRKALDMLDPENPQRVYQRISEHFESRPAPPRDDRPCGPQEVETVLCKWKSHIGGHYFVGKDIHEVREGLTQWGPTAERMKLAMPMRVVNGFHG